MHPRDCFRGNLECDKLALREHLSVVFEFLSSVRALARINPPANVDDRLVIRRFQETDAIVGWEHKSLPFTHFEKALDVDRKPNPRWFTSPSSSPSSPSPHRRLRD